MTKRKPTSDKVVNKAAKAAKLSTSKLASKSSNKANSESVKASKAASVAKSISLKSNISLKNGRTEPNSRRKKIGSKAKLDISNEQRTRMIEEAAYFYSISINDNNNIDNWLRAERDIDSQLHLH